MKQFICILVAVLAFVSCKEKPKSEDIIVDKVIMKSTVETQRMANDTKKGTETWIGGNQYLYTIERQAIDSLKEVVNHDIPYKDNSIRLTVKRSDGSVFFEKEFTKANFSPVLPKQFMDSGVLLGMAFDKVQGNEMYFAVSVGSPDDTNEEYYVVYMVLDNYGNTRAEAYEESIQ